MKTQIKISKPTSAGRRGHIHVKNHSLHRGRPQASLSIAKPQRAGRNNQGRITAWQRGGGHKRKYRVIDWRRADKDGIPAKVLRIEYDPNRSANIALLSYADGEKRYIIAPKDLKVGQAVQSGPSAPLEVGNCLPLNKIRIGFLLHCIELEPGKGAQLVRAAGCSARLMALELAKNSATLLLKSGEMREFSSNCRAVIGEIGNSEYNLRKLGKAGRSRWLNKRPKVRGVAMNPVDHPLGGGEGRSSGGRAPCSPTGLPEGTKTRKRKLSDRLIVRSRSKKK